MSTSAKLLVTGDFCPIHRMAERLGPGGETGLFGGLQSFIREADLAVTNLECPLTGPQRGPIPKTGPAMRARPEAAGFLKRAGFGLVTLANNHIMDYGPEGLRDTLEALEAEGVDWIGAGEDYEQASTPYRIRLGGLELALINVAENEWSTTTGRQPGAHPLDPVRNAQRIREAREGADVVIVISHGGHEHYELPSPRMKELFRFFIDQGADAVVNHHTHCVSGYERYRGKPIFYSLGNFVFDLPGRRNAPWNTGLALLLELSAAGVDFELIPFDQCDEQAGIVLQEGAAREETLDHLEALNAIIQDDEQLQERYRAFCRRSAKLYNAYIEPHSNRYVHALRNRGFLPSLLSSRKRRLLLNLVRCEAHRDVLIETLRDGA